MNNNRTKSETISLKFFEGTKARIQALTALSGMPETMTDVLLLGLDALEAGWRPDLSGYPNIVTDILGRLAVLEARDNELADLLRRMDRLEALERQEPIQARTEPDSGLEPESVPESAPETESFSPPATYDRERSAAYIRFLAGQGLGSSAIARRLDAERWPTAKAGVGGGWRESSVRSLK